MTDLPRAVVALEQAEAELNAASVEAWRQGVRLDVDPQDVADRAADLWQQARADARTYGSE